MAEKWHSGISMHKLPVASGFIGLVFTVGCALIFLLGLPQLWYFVVLSAALGLVLALFFRLINDRRSERLKPLSILTSHVSSRTGEEAERSKKFVRAPRACLV